MNLKQIRNFCIIAHIDHGKSTLADRFIEMCGGLSKREMADQVLDSLDIERERGITIKAQSVSLIYRFENVEYQFNIIDTPGHVDFSYEVSRSLSACEGAILLVDATQGVEAQTVSVCNMAVGQNLQIIPVINKMDLSQAQPEIVKQEIEDIIGIEASNALMISGKTGKGVKELLDRIIIDVPAPSGSVDSSLQALIVDSWFDNYLGVISLVRVVSGKLSKGMKIKIMSNNQAHFVEQLGRFTPKRQIIAELSAGEVGYVIAGIKDIEGAPVGDTITSAVHECEKPLPGFVKAQPQVFAGLYPIDSSEFEPFRDALAKLRLNDSALNVEPEHSQTFGFGFRCGFLGLLHMEIVKERLEREYNVKLVTTAPTVIYKVITTRGEELMVDNPSKLPPVQEIESISEPVVETNIIVPQEYIGAIMKLCLEKRGIQKGIQYYSKQVSMKYEIPMSEVMFDFYDRLKSISKGYASQEYVFKYYADADLVKLDILLNGEKIDALSMIVHRDKAYYRGNAMTEKLARIIPRQMFDVAVQAAIGKNVISRQTIKALRKNVTAKCYGGDVSRKRKLLEKQKEGKKRMKQIGKVSIPQEAFISVLKVDE